MARGGQPKPWEMRYLLDEIDRLRISAQSYDECQHALEITRTELARVMRIGQERFARQIQRLDP